MGALASGAWREPFAAAALRAGQEALDDTVFQRMEGDDRQASAGAQHALGGFEPAFQFAQLVIHIDAQRLKGARRRMDRMAGGRRAHRLGDDLRERGGAFDRAGPRRWRGRCGANAAPRR